MHDPEAVGDVGVGQAGEGVGELGALLVGLGGLARVEAEVLEQHDVTVGHAGDRGLGALAHRVGGEGDRAAEQLGEPPDDRGQRVALLGSALRAGRGGRTR